MKSIFERYKPPVSVKTLSLLSLLSAIYYGFKRDGGASRASTSSSFENFIAYDSYSSVFSSLNTVVALFQVVLAVYLYTGSKRMWFYNTLFLIGCIAFSFTSSINWPVLLVQMIATVLSLTPSSWRYFNPVKDRVVSKLAADNVLTTRRRVLRVIFILLLGAAVAVAGVVVVSNYVEDIQNEILW